MSHAEDIEKNYDVLLRCTTINHYVIDFLKAEAVLDRMQEAELRTQKNPIKQCIMLFQWLKDASYKKYESFLQVMKDTEQEHVTNLLRGSTGEDHLPLSESRHQHLDKIRPKIANVICIENEVIPELRSFKAISRTDAEEIRAEKVDYVKISKLLSAIMRRSNHSYDSFQQVLRKTLQMAAAEYLSEGEMSVVHLNNNRPDLDGPLSRAFNETIRSNSECNTDIKELLTEMNGFGLNVVKAIPGQSIVIFIYCKTVQNAVKFTQLFNSGRLQCILESIFNRLLLIIEPRNKETLESRIILEDEDIISLTEFTGIEGWMRERSNRPKSLGKICGCDASTQTDEESFVKKETDLMPVEFEKIASGSRILYGTEMQTELQLEDDDSCVYDKLSAELEKMTYESSVYSSAMSHIADDDDSGVYGWSQKRRTFKKPEEIKPSRYDLGSSAYAGKINIPEYLNSLGMPKPSFVTQRQSVPEDIYPDLSVSSEDVASLKWKLTETQKEKDKLKKVLEHHTDIGDLPEKYKSHPILLQTIRTKAAEEKQKSIRGFTILDKELFVVSENSSEVEVYDSMKFSFRRRWILMELIDPRDIVCCSINKCLYMFNLTGWPNKILRVDPNGELIKTWSTGGDYGYGLSVTHETNVILTVTNKNKLYEYSPDGQLILEVNLSSVAGIHWPWHAVKLTNGHFVVSYGEDDDDTHSVCVVDADGKLEKSFCEKCRPIIGHMDYPMHLAVDGNGFVMVADRGNSRVLLLNSDLEFMREILSKEKHGFGNPTRIHLDESTGRLFVADRGRNSQQISIFSLDNYYYY